jgi:hypothetical protein
MSLPNFVIIGAAKSGTTALVQYLEQHPSVFLCEPKEPHFFPFVGRALDFRGPGDDAMINSVAVTDPTRYEQLFARAGRATAIGEASVSNLYYPEASGEMKRRLDDPKLICLLRNPADRAFSAYMYMVARGFEPEGDFRRALDDEDRRIRENWHHIWHYRRMGYYHQQLAPYYADFGADRVRVYLFEDLRRDPVPILRDCLAFLGLPPDFSWPYTPSPLISGLPRLARLNAFLLNEHPAKKALRNVVPRKLLRRASSRLLSWSSDRKPLDNTLRRELLSEYENDISQLASLIGRDLSAWNHAPERPLEAPWA